MRSKVIFTFFLISIIAVVGSKPCRADGKLAVTASILPQKYFVKKIGGDLVTVSVMVLPGFSPATYEPKPVQLKNLHASRIYFAIGVPFERYWLERFKKVNPDMAIAYTDQGIKKRQMMAHNHGLQEKIHGEEEKNTEKNDHPDPHIWLSPPLVKSQARVIAEFLIQADPANREVYESNLLKFEDELDRLDRRMKEILEFNGIQKAFLVFHPTWGYFADHYGLKQIPMEVEGKEPGAAYLAECIRFARTNGIEAVFVQPQFSTKSAQVVARETDAKVVIADPLSGDWERNLLHVAEKFRLNSGVKEKIR